VRKTRPDQARDGIKIHYVGLYRVFRLLTEGNTPEMITAITAAAGGSVIAAVWTYAVVLLRRPADRPAGTEA
jgi:hypothetical protein